MRWRRDGSETEASCLEARRTRRRRDSRRRRGGGEMAHGGERRGRDADGGEMEARWRRDGGSGGGDEGGGDEWRERRGWLLTLTLTLTRVRSCGFSRRSHSEHPALEVSRRTCGSVRRHDWRVIRRPASSPTRLSALAERASIAPRAERRVGTPQCRRLHHARGSSRAPARGQAARERRASGVAAEPRARAACAPAARACAQATRRGGGVLRRFERCPGSRGGGR